MAATSESKNEMESGLLLDVVVREGSTVFELLSSEDESLLIGRDTLLILDLGLDVVDGVTWLDLKSDSLSGEGLNEDLHTTTESQDQMKSGFLLDVIVGKGTSILKLFSGEDKSLLIRWDTFLVLNLGLNVLNGIGWLDFEGDGLTGEGLDEDLHTSTKSEDKMKSGLFLDVVIGKGASILKLLSSKDKSLLVRRDALFVLDLGFDILDSVRWLDLKGDGLASESLYENLHVEVLFFLIDYKVYSEAAFKWSTAANFVIPITKFCT